MNLSPELGPVHFTQRVCGNCDTPSAERCTFNLVLHNRQALAQLAPFDGEADSCECQECRSPQPTPSGDTWHPPPDLHALAIFCALLFGVPMLMCLYQGCDLIVTWWELRRVKRP